MWLGRRSSPLMEAPEMTEPGYGGRKIAQSTVDESHVLRVVYEDLPDMMRVITFYTGRRGQNED